MAQLRPLRLVSQRANQNINSLVKSDLVIDVVVDTPVLHLDGNYTYAISEKEREFIKVGSLVKIPFGKTVTTGYVLNIRDRVDSDVSIKGIVSVISSQALLQPKIWNFVKAAAARYCINPSDLIRFAIPARVASCERTIGNPALNVAPKRKIATSKNTLLESIYGAKIAALVGTGNGAILAPTAIDTFLLLTEMIQRKIQTGATLVIVPDLKDLNRLEKYLSDIGAIDFIRFDSSLAKTDRYSAFLQILRGEKNLVIGNRSAIFAPIPNLKNLIILNESDPSHFERRSPYANTRDLALLRSTTESISLWFLDASPSLELLRLVDSKWLPFFTPEKIFSNERKWSITAESDDFARKNLFTVIRKGLSTGPVLVVVAERGYFNSATCNQCKNQALCRCGGKLIIGKNIGTPECLLCNEKYPEWKCKYCNTGKLHRYQKGDERHLEEFGKAFPKVLIISSNGKMSKDSIDDEKVIVIATPGSEPATPNGYGAIVLLDGKSIFNRPFLRSEEEARYRWLNALTSLKPGGDIYLSLPESHPEVQSILQSAPLKSSKTELENRRELSLPPFSRFIEVQSESKEINQIAQQFKDEKSFACDILGPSQVDKLNSKIILKVPIANGAKLGEIIYDLQRYRSAKGKKPLRVQVDPFTI